MLQRVVIDNYKIFNKRQTVDFSEKAEDTSRLFTLVGENGCGKSTLLKVVGFASNFGCQGPIRSLRVCDKSRESVVACEYRLENLAKLACPGQSNFTSTYPEFKLWYVDGILKIPEDLQQVLKKRIEKSLSEAVTSPVTLVIGFKRTPSPESSNETICSFIFVKSGPQIIVLIQPFNQNAIVGVADGETTVDMLNWFPDPSSLENREVLEDRCSFLKGDGTDLEARQRSKIQEAEDSHPKMIMKLRDTICLGASRDDIWKEAIELFHKLTGDQKITVEYKPASNSVIIIEKLDGVAHEKQDLPEGFLYALVVALLLVSPRTETVLLDEPTRAMHPLQIRRVRRILSQESSKRDKIIIITSHAPDMLHGSPIDQIFRFRRFKSGYSEIYRVSSSLSKRETRFIGAAETRELFFTRRILWVEGDTDRRFCDTMLKLIDEGSESLRKPLPNPVEPQVTGSGPIQNLFASPAYKMNAFLEKDLEECRELARTCSVLPLSGKRNIGKAIKICKDLSVPYCGIIDLDALLPGSKDDLKSQFNRNAGDWTKVPVNGSLLLKTDKSPACLCVRDDPKLEPLLQSCQNAHEVIEFYEKESIFGWRVEGGEIEDLVRITRNNFKKDEWKDFSFDDFQDLIEEMLNPRNANGPNLEILRCFHFILRFLKSSD